MELVELDETYEPEGARRPISRPSRPVVIGTALVVLGLVQSAALAANRSTHDGRDALTTALFPPPAPRQTRTVTLISTSGLPAEAACSVPGQLFTPSAIVHGVYGQGDADAVDVLLLRYPDAATAQQSVDNVRQSLANGCHSFPVPSVAHGTVDAAYRSPTSFAGGHGLSVSWSAGGGTASNPFYFAAGEVAVVSRGSHVVVASETANVYGTGRFSASTGPQEIVTDLADRLG